MNPDDITFAAGLAMPLSICVLAMVPQADRQNALAIAVCVMALQISVIQTILYLTLPYVELNVHYVVHGLFLILGFSLVIVSYAVPALYGSSRSLWRLPKVDERGVSRVESQVFGIFLFVVYIVMIATTSAFVLNLMMLN